VGTVYMILGKEDDFVSIFGEDEGLCCVWADLYTYTPRLGADFMNTN